MFFGRTLSTREQARIIRQEAIALLDSANEFSTNSRRVNRRAAYKVISRSLSKSKGLPFSIRKHQAITELSNYIALAKHNKVVGLNAFNTDLLPISHPRSTKLHALSASSLARAKMQWYLDDPRIKDNTVRSLVASAMSSSVDSPEHKYAMTRLENLPASEIPLDVLTAAANPYGGRNSAAARRAREAIQLSDRFERWINMGRSAERRMTDGFRSYVRRKDGTTVSHSGEVLNQNLESPQLIDIEVGKGRVAVVPIKSGEGLEAFIRDADSVDGFSKTEAKPNNAPVIPEENIVFLDAPSIYRKEDDYRGKGTKYTDDKYDIIKFDNPKDALDKIDDSKKRAAEMDKPAPREIKLGETDPDTGRQFWNPDEPVFAVSRRGKGTAFAFTQKWKDVNNEILRDEPDLDEEEGRDYTRPEPKKEGDPDDLVPLLEQADKIFDGRRRKPSQKKEEVPSFPYTVPDRAYEFNPNEEYTPEFDFDDPQFLASDQEAEALDNALLQAVEPVSATERAVGNAPIELTDGRNVDVPAEAIAAAIKDQGGDPEMSLAKAYDKIAGNTKNEDDLLASRGEKRAEEAAKPKDLEEKFDEVVREEEEKPKADEITEEGVEATPKETGAVVTDGDVEAVPALKGLSDEEKKSIVDSDGDYTPFIKSEDIEVPEGMYKPGVSTKDDRKDAIGLAGAPRSSYPNKLLNDKLKEAMEGDGKAKIEVVQDGELTEEEMSAEALRDAISLRGKDGNEAVRKIAKPKKTKAEKPEEEEKPAEEEKPKAPVGTYQRAGNRTLLRNGTGKPFDKKELADFLAENDFEYTEKTPDGRPVYAHSKQQSDEEFKAFARELRDRFGIDMKPRPGTDTRPAQEEIDIDAPAPEKPAEEAPTPVAEEKSEEVKEEEKPEEAPAIPPTVPPTTPPSGQGEEQPEEEPKPDPKKPMLISWRNAQVNDDQKIMVQDGNVFTLDGKFLGKIPEGFSEEEFLRSYYYRASRTGRDAKAILEAIQPSEKDKPYDAEEYPSDEEEIQQNEAIKKQDEEIEDLLTDDRYKKDEEVNAEDVVNEAIVESAKEEKPIDLAGLIRNLQNKRAKADGALANPYNLSRKEMISRIMWFKWGAGAVKNESWYIRNAMKEFEKNLDKLSNEELVKILDLFYDEMDLRIAEQRAAEEKAEQIRQAREKKRREREAKLLGEEEAPAEAVDGRKRLTKEERPTGTANDGDLSPGGDWVYRVAKPGDPTSRTGWFASDQLNEKYRKYGYDESKWPEFEEEEPKAEAPAAEETPEFDGPWLYDSKRDKYFSPNGDWVFAEDGKGGGKWVLTTTGKKKGAEDREKIPTGNPLEKPEEEAVVETEATPAKSLVKAINVKTSELQPGDVMVEDHFTITDVKREGSKQVRVDGALRDVPTYRITGYFPGSQEQSSKLWSDNYAPDIYRGSTPPVKGDLPELNQPKAEDYGAVFPNQDRVNWNGRTIYTPKDPEQKKKFLEDYKVYDEERMRRKALWNAPEVEKEAPVVNPQNLIYTDRVSAPEVRVGDITFRRNDDGSLREFFVVTNVLEPQNGKVRLEGHYAGHQTQVKEWNDTARNIEVIRGESNLPAAGDKETLDRPDKDLDNYDELEAARQAKIDEADKNYTPVFPTDKAFKGITPLERKPNLPAFYGSAEEMLAAGDGTAVMKALDDAGFIVFDFETVGKDVNNSVNPDAPIQVAAAKYVGGKKVDSLNLFINPNEPLGSYYYETDEQGNRVLKASRLRDSEGNPITDEWLATQPDIKDQLEKLIEFFGDKPILVGQNNTFDINLLERWAEKLGLDFSMGGAVDTKGIAQALQSVESKSIVFPTSPKDGDTFNVNGFDWRYSEKAKRWIGPSNSLKPLADRLGVKTQAAGDFHDAAFDIDVTEKVLRALMGKLKAGDIKAKDGTKKYDAAYDKWIQSRNQRAEDIREIEVANMLSSKSTLDDAIKNVNAVSDEKIVVVDGEESVVTPKPYKSAFSDEIIDADWIRNPENAVFIPDARIKDLKLGDFIVGKNGNFQEVIKIEADEVDPANASKVFRVDIEDGVVLENRDSEREDGGTGFYLSGRLEGGIFRRISNKDKSSAQINTEAMDSKPYNETPVVIEPIQPVKGEPLNDDQKATVVADAVDVITSGAKPDATIEEAVKGLNVDESIKEQVVGSDREVTSAHLSADGVQLAPGDRVINVKNKRVGKVSTLMGKYGKKEYKNYVKVKYDDYEERVPVAGDSLRVVDAADPNYTPKVINAGTILRPESKPSTKTVSDVAETIKNIQSQPTPEGVTAPESLPNPDELAKTWKDKEAERNKLAEDLNFVSLTPEALESIKGNAPARITTKSFMPSLKTGQPMDVTFGFDKPNGREIASYADTLNISSPDDILVFKATPSSILRNEHLATIKPDGTIVWKGDIQKQNHSVDLKNALDQYSSPVMGLQAMAVMAEEDEEEDSPSVLGTSEDTFDYSRLSKTVNPTSEQRSVIQAIMTGKDVVVRALAGTGKTSTLKLAAKRLKEEKPDKNITYIVFNKSVQQEAVKEFPDNTDPRTADSIGYWNVDPALRKKARDEKNAITNNPDISKHLGIVPTPVKVKGTEQNLSTRDIPTVIRAAINNFTASDSDTVTVKHFAGLNLDEVPAEFIDWANKWWADISSPEGKLAVSPSDLTKVWALSKPDFSKGIVGQDAKGKTITRKVDIVFYDEAQDINPVMAKVMREQPNIQTVYVGDSNQAIYGFRGAIDELDNVVADYDLPITETFRFGEKIAGIGNRFLTKLNSKYRIKGLTGKDGEILDVMDDPTVIITRTNGGGISAIFEMLDKGKVVGIDEKTYNDYTSLLRNIKWLIAANKGTPSGGRPKPHPDLANFNTWAEVLSAVQKGESLGSAAYMVNILRERSVSEVEDILSRVEKITAKKETPTEPFVPLTAEDLKDGSKGVLGFRNITSKGGRAFPVKVEYSVEGKTITITNGTEYRPQLKADGYAYVPENYTDRKDFANPEDVLPLLNKIKRSASGYGPEKPIEVEVITAHKAKGKQWKRVRIYGDFKGPELSEEDGSLKLPADEEMRLSYVAVTRAEEALELGSLDWIRDVTSDADESPNLSPVEGLLGMAVGVDPDPVTPEEAAEDTLSTAKKMDEKTEAIADLIIASIEKGVAPWRKPWDGAGFLPTSVSTGKAYQGSNVLVLWATAMNNGWSDNRWLTFNQAKKLGGFIKKGEKATSIIHWTPRFREIEKPDGTKEKQFYWTPPKVIQVFNVEQAEGIKLPPLTTRDPVPVSEIETTILETYTDHPEIINKAGDRAFYSPIDDKITLPLREQFKSTQDFLETFIHELAHSTGHSTRLGKEGKRKELQDNYGDHRASRGEEELIAEISVALLAAELGFEIDWGNLASYANSWLEPLKNDKSMILVAAKQAQDAVNWMMGRRSTEEGSEEAGASTGQTPVGEGVGSAGQTGEQIAEEAEAKPEETPQPNVGTEGQTGEQIGLAKNRDTSITPEKFIDESGQESELWNDVIFDPEEKEDPNIENIHFTLAKELKNSGPEKLVDRNDINDYITNILQKYGYGNKFFMLANKKTSDEILGPIPTGKARYLEASVSRANNRPIPQNSSLKDKEFPMVLVRSEGASRIVLLHEIAHMMDGAWKTGEAGGHTKNWYETFLGLLDGEGFSEQANLIRSTVEKGGN